MTAQPPALSAPAALVRRHDLDRFRFALFAPARHREAVFTLFAFNHEVAKTRESVSETMIGAIRLQWWRDSIEGIYAGTPRQHEVIGPLAACIAAYGLPRAPFEALINARERDLEDEGARKAVKQMAEHAQTLIERGLARTPKHSHLAPLLLPARQARARIRLLTKLDYDPFRPEFADHDPLDVWRFWLARLIRRY